ncbi:hypothetical protein CP533_4182 [Ophiocordyceps camponoti-saundersi (nom. inval.)]|nr:hypothetical protein CP533_4182 [Ophiocordyceps camponoti-saundersi (nom. inval.)]
MPRPGRGRRGQAATLSQAPRSIDAFARISKSQRASSQDKPAAGTSGGGPASRKRKATAVQDAGKAGLVHATLSSGDDDNNEASRPASLKRICRREDDAPKSARKRKRVVRESPSVQGPKRQRIVVEVRNKCQRSQVGAEAGSACKKSVEEGSLPSDFADLVDLNRALLRTVVLHVAHHGANTPMDVRTMMPHISRTWGQREVTLEDVRRCMAVQSHAGEPSPLIMCDYGRGRICIELASGLDGGIMDEERLGKQFRENLGALCAGRRAEDDAVEGVNKDDMSMVTDEAGGLGVDVLLRRLSMTDLGQVAVTDVTASVKTNNATLAKGQRALSELKSGAATAKDKQQQQQQHGASEVSGSKTSLLERLRAKKLAKASEPLPPTASAVRRRTALNRVGEAAATISMLGLGTSSQSGRQAFTMKALSQKVRDSQRMPMSEEESEACVRVLATEVAPGWLRLVTLAGRENVVVQRGGQPMDGEVEDRVRRLLAAAAAA